MNNKNTGNSEPENDIQCVVKLFLAGVPPSVIHFSSSILVDESSQVALLNKTVLRRDRDKYPLSRKFMIAFLKELIRQAESESEYVADALYETLVPLVNECSGQESFFRIYCLQNGSVVRVRENANTLSQGSTGLSHWQATYYLSQFVDAHRECFRHKNILELGCGLGLLGLTIVQLAQPLTYIFTDYNASVLRLLCANIVSTFDLAGYEAEDLLNGAEISVNNGATIIRIQELDWTYWRPDNDQQFVSGLDVVLAADVAYDPSAVPDFVRVANSLLTSPTASETSCAYVAHTVRHKATFELLQSELSSRSCKTELQLLTIPKEVEKRTLPNCSPSLDFECVLLHIAPSRKSVRP